MNMQERSDSRSLALHRATVKRLKENPELWDVPLRNIDQWTQPDGSLPMAYVVWKEILQTWTHEAIVKLLLSRSQRATQLRSSSPFVGIISQEERNRIFEKYNKIYRRGTVMEDKNIHALKQELETLKAAVRDYLKHPSLDGAPVRQEQRKKLAELVKRISTVSGANRRARAKPCQ